MPTESDVLSVLRQIKYPGLSRDIVSFGFVKDLAIDGGVIRFRLEMTTESPRAGEEIKREAEEKLRALPGVTDVGIRMDVRLPTFQQPPPTAKTNAVPGVRHIVAVASGKGGVGKSTVSANLAIALAKLGFKVGLMDSDIYGPSQQMMMGIDEKPFVDENEKILPIERHGVRVISIGFITDPDQPVIWRGPMVMRAVEQLLMDVTWGELDFLLVDMPPGTGDAQLTLTQKVALSGAVVVTTPQDVALIDARKGLAMFRKVGVPLLGIVENMSFYECPKCGHHENIFSTGGGERTAKELGVPFLGRIPIDPKVVTGGDKGTPIVASDPEGVVGKAFLETAKAVAKTLGG